MPDQLLVRPCPSCNSASSTPLLTQGDYSVIRCSDCGLLITNPIPHQDIDHLYDADFFGEPDSRITLWNRLWSMARKVVNWERRRTLSAVSGKTLLDLGCGDGAFLASLPPEWNVQGIEFAAAAIQLAQPRHVTIHQCPLEDAPFAPASMDVITMWHVLEHLPDPRRQLQLLARLLRPGGALVIEVPDAASPTFRILGSRWFALDLPRHLQHFTRQSLATLLAATGFRIDTVHASHLIDPVVIMINVLRLFFPENGRRYPVSTRKGMLQRPGFVLKALLAAMVGFPYGVVMSWVLGRGESITVVARRTEPVLG